MHCFKHIRSVSGMHAPLRPITASQRSLAPRPSTCTCSTVAAPGLDAATLLEVTRSALTAPDINHLRAVADRVPMLCRHVYNAAMATGQPAAGIPLLHTLSRAWPTGTLSPAHLPLLQLCVISRNIQAAKQVVDAPIFAVPGKGDSAVTAPDVLQYYLTAGRVYEELALWAQAAGMYKTCLCLPASGDVPGIIDAYKRWVLTTLLATGGSAQHPKSASQTVLRAASAVAQPYYALVKVFPTVELAVVAAEYAAEYANAGAGVLVDQVSNTVTTAAALLCRLLRPDSHVHSNGAAMPAARMLEANLTLALLAGPSSSSTPSCGGLVQGLFHSVAGSSRGRSQLAQCGGGGTGSDAAHRAGAVCGYHRHGSTDGHLPPLWRC